jgi:hypothetical protein
MLLTPIALQHRSHGTVPRHDSADDRCVLCAVLLQVSEVADTVIVSTTTAAGAVVGAASSFVASIAGTAGRIAGTGTGTAFGNGPVVQGRADLV